MRPSQTAIENSIKILFLSAEAAPLVKVGGLGDVAGSLPNAIRELKYHSDPPEKIDIRVAIPYYPSIKDTNLPVLLIGSKHLQQGSVNFHAEFYETVTTHSKLYLVDFPALKTSPRIYGEDPEMELEKFIQFNFSCLYLPSILDWNVDILHSNDWHTALVNHILRNATKNFQGFGDTKLILGIHNLPYMGPESVRLLKKYAIPHTTISDLPDWGTRQPLPMGLAASDAIVTVSPTYAKEILTSEFGCGLEKFLVNRKDRVFGILNGLDINYWNPQSDPDIPVHFSQEDLDLRSRIKSQIQENFKLVRDDSIPLLVVISRMDWQKGIDLLFEGFHKTRNWDFQLILLGTGNPELEKASLELQKVFPDNVRSILQFDLSLSKRLYAGGDMILLPSRYEPCGLAQLIAMRYGCIPVARRTGGLADTIIDSGRPKQQTGFLFEKASAASFLSALDRALESFQNKNRWRTIQKNAMNQDFSWTISAQRYLELYKSLLT